MCMRFLVQRQLLFLTVQNHGKENPEFCCEKNLLSFDWHRICFKFQNQGNLLQSPPKKTEVPDLDEFIALVPVKKEPATDHCVTTAYEGFSTPPLRNSSIGGGSLRLLASHFIFRRLLGSIWWLEIRNLWFWRRRKTALFT